MPTSSETPSDYRCPFCPDHKDYDFIRSDLADADICLGCRDEIACGLDFREQPTAREYSGADTIEKLLQRRGISYGELQRLQEQSYPAEGACKVQGHGQVIELRIC